MDLAIEGGRDENLILSELKSISLTAVPKGVELHTLPDE